MTQFANTIQPVLNTRVKIGANNYELHIPKIVFGRTVPKPVTFQGGTPEAQYSGATPAADNTVSIHLGHDYQNVDSAYNFFRDHEGQTATLEWMPDAAGIYKETTTITIVSPNPGGDYGKQHESDVVCPCTKPVHTMTNAAAPTITSFLGAPVATAGGGDLLIKGTNMHSATQVTVAGTPVPFTYLGTGRLLVEGAMPAHAAGNAAVVVTNPTGASAPVNVVYA